MAARALFAALAGYLVGAFGGGFIVSALSGNTHDRSVEAAMTGAFILGPLGAAVGCLIAFLRARGKPR